MLSIGNAIGVSKNEPTYASRIDNLIEGQVITTWREIKRKEKVKA